MSESRTGGFFRPWRIPESEAVGIAVDCNISCGGRENDDDSVASSISTVSTTSVVTLATTAELNDRLPNRDAADGTMKSRSLVDVRHHKNARRGSESSEDYANSNAPSLQGEEIVGVRDAVYDSRAFRDGRRAADYSAALVRDDIGALRDICPLGYYSESGFPRPEDLAPMNGGVYATSLVDPDTAGTVVNAGMAVPGFVLSLAGLRPVIHRMAHPEVHRAIQSAVYPGILSAGFYNRTMEEAAEMVHRQDAAAKRMKKMRPKKFRCQHCEMAFSNNGQLKGHVRIHTGERPFKCDVESCGKSFTRNEELTRHKRIHTGVRPHSCVVCGKRFGRKDHLKKHTRTHEVRDPYRVSAALGMLALGHPFQQAAELPSYVYQI